MLTVSTRSCRIWSVAGRAEGSRGAQRHAGARNRVRASKASKAGKAGKAGKATPRSSYHHGDLPRAMLEAAVRTIQREGVHALTLRGVGQQLGVSRTALYRHFANKDALLQAVADEGFRTLQSELQHAWTNCRDGREGFDAMGHAYVRFAVRHPSHYRVMFGGALRDAGGPARAPDSDGDAFGTLVHALENQQRDGLVRPGDPRQLALYVWAVVHGVAMLAIDGILNSTAEVEQLAQFAIDRIRNGIGANDL